MLKLIKTFLVLFSLAIVVSCGSGDQMQDLRQKLKEIDEKPKGRIPAPPEFKAFESYTYQAAGLRSPFELPAEEITVDISASKFVKPDFERRKQALEKFSLDSMAFVGTLSKEKLGNELYALVDDGEGNVHRVEVGDYLGQNFGKILTISARKVEIREIVPSGQLDDEGNKLWIERPRNLVLRDE